MLANAMMWFQMFCPPSPTHTHIHTYGIIHPVIIRLDLLTCRWSYSARNLMGPGGDGVQWQGS